MLYGQNFVVELQLLSGASQRPWCLTATSIRHSEVLQKQLHCSGVSSELHWARLGERMQLSLLGWISVEIHAKGCESHWPHQ